MFAIDDTGHERLKGQSVYGLGGCAVMGRDYYRALAEPWRRRRGATTGNFGGALHAAEFGHRASRANIAAMGRFFANQPFFRFAAVSTRNTEYPRDRELMAWVMPVLKGYVSDWRAPGRRPIGKHQPKPEGLVHLLIGAAFDTVYKHQTRKPGMTTSEHSIKISRGALLPFQSPTGHPSDSVHNEVGHFQRRFARSLRHEAVLDGDLLSILLKFECSEKLDQERICSLGCLKYQGDRARGGTT